MRAVLGDDRDVAVDFHGRFTTTTAQRVPPELVPLHPLFVEEPVLPEHRERLADVVRASPVPIACGERLYSRADFLPALRAGVAVVQPDLSHAGGISEVRRIASLAEVHDALLAPHCPLGPIALAASLQVAFATPNFLIQEQSIGIHYNTGAELLDYVLDRTPFTFHDGAVRRWDAPGLGSMSTRTRCAGRTRLDTDGDPRCGGTRTGRSPHGDGEQQSPLQTGLDAAAPPGRRRGSPRGGSAPAL